MSFQTMASRVQYLGGSQLDRIKKNKLRSLRMALKNDYNTRMIRVPNGSVWPCLIRTLSGGLKSDYSKQLMSVEFDSGLTPGDTFEILDDCTHWMVYLPIETETAYLRSEVVQCDYTLEVNGKKYWIYIQGPTETDLRWFLKNNINANELNLSGTIYIKKDENTKKFFKRFTRIKIDGHAWEVQVTDSLTVDGIIELEIQEYYDNSIEELPEIKKATPDSVDTITGMTTVKQNTIVGYSIDPLFYSPGVEWKIIGNERVRINEVLENGRICKVKIYPGAIKTFDLCYGDQRLTVKVDWKQSRIQGPVSVYPYDVHKYWIKQKKDQEKDSAEFTINNNMAKIIDFGDDWCEVEIVNSKKGVFTISAKGENIDESLDVEIKSL